MSKERLFVARKGKGGPTNSKLFRVGSTQSTFGLANVDCVDPTLRIRAACLLYAPADARAAFQRGAIDAWAIWDPFFVAAQKQLGARVLTDAKGIVNRYQFFLSAREFAEKNPDVVLLRCMC